MKGRQWSLLIVMILINYIIFASLFSRLMEMDFGADDISDAQMMPTFTPAPAEPMVIIPTPTPSTPIPTPTATRVLDGRSQVPAEGASTAAQESQPAAELTAPGPVNIRSGPGLGYNVIGGLNANSTAAIVGRNADASWWQIRLSDVERGWVASFVVESRNTEGIPQVEAPPLPVVEAPPAPVVEAPPDKPRYQFEPTGWYDDTNEGLTRFMGDIIDINGNPVNGVFVEARCGDFSTISFPSGSVGWGHTNASAEWPAGFYDVTVNTEPVPCVWALTVVATDDRSHITAVLSESVPVIVSPDKSIIVANWRKNW